MKIRVLCVVAGISTEVLTGPAVGDGPVALSDGQLDAVTAGAAVAAVDSTATVAGGSAIGTATTGKAFVTAEEGAHPSLGAHYAVASGTARAMSFGEDQDASATVVLHTAADGNLVVTVGSSWSVDTPLGPVAGGTSGTIGMFTTLGLLGGGF